MTPHELIVPCEKTIQFRAYSRKSGFSEKGRKGKKGKIFENLGKNVQYLNFFEKGQPHVCNHRTHDVARICAAFRIFPSIDGSVMRGIGFL